MKTLHLHALYAVTLALALFASTAAHAQKYRFPIKSNGSWPRSITNHFDHGSNGVLRDYACKAQTYTRHLGTDISVGGWNGMDAGQDIVAAAEGVVIAVVDGCFDRCSAGGCSCPASRWFGNFVGLQHADGKKTYYAHMKKNSVAVSVGQRVSCGQKLGQVGSSGNSFGPHLHFEVHYSNNDPEDPFKGACGNSVSFWVGQNPYPQIPSTTCASPPPPPPPPPPPAPSCPEVNRVAGSSRYVTAVNVSKQTFPTSAPAVVIASGEDGNPDAIVAGPLARHERGPLLLTRADSLPSATQTEIVRLRPTRAIVVGGTGSVSNAVVSELQGLGLSVTRISGSNRYDTSALVARRIGGAAGFAFVASGEADSLSDALAAAAAAASLKAPLLLVRSGDVPSQVASALTQLGITRTYLAGGVLSVSEAVEQALPNPVRLSGSNRYSTAIEVANAARLLGVSTNRVFITRGDMTTDATTVGATGQLLVLSRTDGLPGVARQFVDSYATRATMVGGQESLNDDVHRELCAALK